MTIQEVSEMQKSNQYIIDFYNHYDEDNRLALKHGMVEFLSTMHYIKKYLKKGDKILEIGAGTGRYSHALAREGYSVDAVEGIIQYGLANGYVFRPITMDTPTVHHHINN